MNNEEHCQSVSQHQPAHIEINLAHQCATIPYLLEGNWHLTSRLSDLTSNPHVVCDMLQKHHCIWSIFPSIIMHIFLSSMSCPTDLMSSISPASTCFRSLFFLFLQRMKVSHLMYEKTKWKPFFFLFLFTVRLPSYNELLNYSSKGPYCYIISCHSCCQYQRGMVEYWVDSQKKLKAPIQRLHIQINKSSNKSISL